MVRNLLPMPERVLQDLNTVQLDVHEWSLECCGVDADRRAAASLLQPRTSGLPRKGRSSPIVARDRDAPKRVCLDSNRSACRRYFTGMIIGYPFGVTTVINHLCIRQVCGQNPQGANSGDRFLKFNLMVSADC